MRNTIHGYRPNQITMLIAMKIILLVQLVVSAKITNVATLYVSIELIIQCKFEMYQVQEKTN